MNFSYFDAIWINTDWKKSISEVNIPGLVCQLSPPMNIFLEREEEEREMNFIFSFKLNNWLNLTINLFNSARFNRKIVLQTRKVSAGHLRLRHKKLVADSWFWHVTVPSDVSAIAADSQKVQAEYKFEIFLRQLSFDMKQRSLHQQNLASKKFLSKTLSTCLQKKGNERKSKRRGRKWKASHF